MVGTKTVFWSAQKNQDFDGCINGNGKVIAVTFINKGTSNATIADHLTLEPNQSLSIGSEAGTYDTSVYPIKFERGAADLINNLVIIYQVIHE